MTQWKRWQDYVTMVFGVLLFISPLVFGETSHHTSTDGAYVLGVLLLASGIVASATKEPRRSLIVNAPGIAAVITFIAAIVLAFGGAPATGERSTECLTCSSGDQRRWAARATAPTRSSSSPWVTRPASRALSE